MELELCKETYPCYDALPQVRETCEQSTETIIPDYCPDIARIVEGSGCFFLRSREIQDGKISVSGLLKVTLLYIADGSGGIKSFEYSLPLEQTLETRLRENCGEVRLSAALTALEVRALNPRKITTRACMEIGIVPYCASKITVCGAVETPEEYGIETLCETQTVDLIRALRSKDFVFSDEVMLSGGKEPAAELLRTCVRTRVSECRTVGGKVVLKGLVCIDLLYLTESGTICRAGAELPFSQLLDGVEDADEDTSAEAFVRLTGTEVRLGGESGDPRCIAVKVFANAFAVLHQKRVVRCIADLYSVSHELSAQMETLALCGGAQLISQEQAVRERIETGVEPSAILRAEVGFGAVSMLQEEDSALARCTAMLRVLYLDEGNAPLLAERRCEISCRIAVPQGCSAAVREITAGEVSAAVTERGIELRFSALITLSCVQPCRCTCLCALRAEPRTDAAAAPSLVLRALRAEQRLWDLAKAYRTTVADILTANEFSSESDAVPGELLLIPRKR